MSKVEQELTYEGFTMMRHSAGTGEAGDVSATIGGVPEKGQAITDIERSIKEWRW